MIPRLDVCINKINCMYLINLIFLIKVYCKRIKIKVCELFSIKIQFSVIFVSYRDMRQKVVIWTHSVSWSRIGKSFEIFSKLNFEKIRKKNRQAPHHSVPVSKFNFKGPKRKHSVFSIRNWGSFYYFPKVKCREKSMHELI